LGAGRGVYEQPAKADVKSYKEISQTQYIYDGNGNLASVKTAHVSAGYDGDP